MEQISMLDLRRDAEAIIRKVQSGVRLVLTYRGKPVARLEPVESGPPTATDPFYQLGELADPLLNPLTNQQIDEILYGK